jgi:hypothetical protein
MSLVKSFKRGSWQAHVVKCKRPEIKHPELPKIKYPELPIGYPRYMVMLEHPNGLNTSWPVQDYDNGKIYYGFEPSRDAKRATQAAFRWLDLI